MAPLKRLGPSGYQSSDEQIYFRVMNITIPQHTLPVTLPIHYGTVIVEVVVRVLLASLPSTTALLISAMAPM